jgi:hypothetical protein
MSFEYPTTTTDDVLAYIDEDGDLRIKVDYKSAVLIFANTHDGMVAAPASWDWEPEKARRLFRAGDSVTIKF